MPDTVRTPEEMSALFDAAERCVRTYFETREETPETGELRVGGDRYLLVRAESMSVRFFELVRSLYADEGQDEAEAVARTLLYDVAHANGLADAQAFAEKLQLTSPMEQLAAGPVHFAFTGWARVELHAESLPEGEDYLLAFTHHNSFEAEAWLDAGRKASFPVCVMSAGYASGWCEASMGLPLVATELSCRACGDDACYFVMAHPDRIEAEAESRRSERPDVVARAPRYEIPGLFRRKRYEEALRERESQYQSIFEAVGDGILVVGPKGHIIEANAAAHGLAGGDAGTLVGTRVAQWMEDPSLLPRMATAANERKARPTEAVLRRFDGTALAVELRVTPYERGAEPHYLAVVRDITERVRTRQATEEWTRQLEQWARQLEERVAERTAELRQANAQLEKDMEARLEAEAERRRLEQQLEQARRMESMGVMAGGVAHDLNNMLGPLVAYPDLLLADLAEDYPLRHLIAQMQRSAEEAGAVLQDLLHMARRGELERTPLSLNDVLRNFLTSANAARLEQERPDIRREVVLAEGLPAVAGSAIHLMKVLLNLVLNACEAMPEGGLLRLSTTPRRLDESMAGFERVPPGNYALLQVQDSGVGIAQEDLHRIFEPFYTRRAGGTEGTGLGLAVVYGVVRDHRAFISIDSEPGRGTTFGLWFPICAADAVSPAPETAQPRGSETVAVVDALPEQRALAARLLHSLGYRSVAFASGADLLAWLDTPLNRIDIALIDMVLDKAADGDGLDVWTRLRARRPQMRAVLTSGLRRSERVGAAQRLGAGPFLPKPFTLSQLAVAIRDELDRVRG